MNRRYTHAVVVCNNLFNKVPRILFYRKFYFETASFSFSLFYFSVSSIPLVLLSLLCSLIDTKYDEPGLF